MSWWECPYVAYAHPADPWTLIARCDSGIAGGTLWRSTLRDVRGIEAMMTQPVRVGGAGRRLRDAAVGFTVECAALGQGAITAVSVPLLWPAILIAAVLPAAEGGRESFEVGLTASPGQG